MRYKNLIFGLLIVSFIFFFAWFTTQDTKKIGMENPASANCIENGGELETKDGKGGEYSLCKFNDGSICEEWKFFNGDCKKGEVFSDLTNCEIYFNGCNTCVVENGVISSCDDRYCAKEEKSEPKCLESKNHTTTDPHSFARPDEVVVNHLDLDIVVNFEEKEISGEAKLYFENKVGANELYLDTYNLTIERITLGEDEEETKFTLGEPVKFLGQALMIEIEPQTEFVTVHYSTNPEAKALQWLEPQQTTGKKHPFLFTQSEPILIQMVSMNLICLNPSHHIFWLLLLGI
jgi:putative hemolysin